MMKTISSFPITAICLACLGLVSVAAANEEHNEDAHAPAVHAPKAHAAPATKPASPNAHAPASAAGHGKTNHANPAAKHASPNAHAPAAASEHGKPAHAPATTDAHGKPTAAHANADNHGEHATAGHDSTSHEAPAGHGAATAHEGAKHEEPHAPPLPPVTSTWCGKMPRDRMVWSASRGPLTLTGDLLIDSGQSLEIAPGVEIRIASRDACPQLDQDELDRASIAILVAGGRLRLVGTPKRPIRIVPQRPGNGLGWTGIRAAGVKAGDLDVVWTIVSRATTGISLIASRGLVAHNRFEDCGNGMEISGGALPMVRNNVFARSLVTGIWSRRSAPTIESNLFIDGKGDGVRFDGLGLASVQRNAFWNHRGKAIVRGPRGSGMWRNDSLIAPDKYGNLETDPLLRGSSKDIALLRKMQQSQKDLPWYAPASKRRARIPPGEGPWSLSGFSPLLDKGPMGCFDSDKSRCDIGLWGRY